MKKSWVVAVVAVLGIGLLYTSAFAQWGMGCGGGRGYGYGAVNGKPVDVAAFQTFQKETLPLRDEMMVKRLELRNEYGKEKADQNRIAALEKEVIDLRAKIQASAEKQGFTAAGFGPGTAGRGPGWRGQRFAGRGYGERNCPMW
ncbi:MAG TPA: hypothetical protein VGJ94_18415 [Syntrophorhabdaceae bacterium]|jgi:zinc resistance-associated protein